MKLYCFSPIKNKKQFLVAVKYVVLQSTKLCKKSIGKKLPIICLTIFAHYTEEYNNLVKIALKLGKIYSENNGPYVYLKNPLKIGSNTIKYLRIRKPDPYRMQVGCNNFEVEDYQSFKRKYLTKDRKNLRLIKRPNYEMIEFFDPDFDVLAYVVSKDIFT